jgi:hypothetical protein
MALSEVTLDALRKEVGVIEAKIERVEDQMRKLVAERQSAINDREAMLRLIGSPDPPKTGADVSGLQFRDAIRVTIGSAGRPMRAKEVAQAMLANGFKDSNAATPLRVRVGNEMYKLVKSKEIQNSETGFVPT